MSTEVVEFRNQDGLKLVGKLFKPASYSAPDGQKERIVVICHGYLCTKDKGFIPQLAEALDVPTFRFDFSGNGESEGEFKFANYMGEAEDLRSAVEMLRNIGYDVCAVVGHSKGAGVVLLYAAKYDDVPVVVNIAGRFHMSAGIRERYSPEDLALLDTQGFFTFSFSANSPRFTITKDQMDERLNLDMSQVAAISRSKVYTFHGTKDVTIPCADAEEFRRVIKQELHTVTIVQGADHNFKNKEAILFQGIRDVVLSS
eukprot:GILI01027903.1.p1 GENE.GILI01027903.1~~GILI01027903.1.p1  ORF type:complete len:257 (-),score=63.95 GILI01027903.1:68-838(-)